MTVPDDQSPAELLTGLSLDDGWTVTSKLTPGPNATGGFFSVGYEVQHAEWGTAFLKALDFSAALEDDDPVSMINALTQAYIFECDLVRECTAHSMSHVVSGLTTGYADAPIDSPISRVAYIIFERADHDARAHLELMTQLDLAWVLRSLHNVANGIRQLHARQIAHQDLKPSNVLVFGRATSKIGDLGRAAWSNHSAPHDGMIVAGSPMYAPPELLYGQLEPDLALRARATDMYHLGSLILFFFAGVGTTVAIANALDPSVLWNAWNDTYQTALPYVQDAFDDVVNELKPLLPPWLRDDLLSTFIELCDPDPRTRGDRKAPQGTAARYSLQRYVTRFDRMTRQAEIELRHKLTT
jgi:serine/threonine protein kinase